MRITIFKDCLYLMLNHILTCNTLGKMEHYILTTLSVYYPGIVTKNGCLCI